MCMDSVAPISNCGPCPHCGSWKTEKNGYCATANFEQRKAERLSKQVKVVTPIRKVSAKQAKDLQDYGVLRRKHLAEHPQCEIRLPGICDGQAVSVHHCAKRGQNLLRADTFKSACMSCHEFVETKMSAEERRERGLLRIVEGTI